MSVLRLILAGLVAFAALAAVLFAAFVVFVSGLVALVLQLFGARRNAPRAAAPRPSGPQTRVMRDADAIDVETTNVPPARPEI